MLSNLLTKISGFIGNKKIAFTVFTLSACAGIIIFSGYKDGPAANGKTVTGAPFNNDKTCSSCHSGSDYGSSVSTQLLDAGNNPVSIYNPGQNYTFKITVSETTVDPVEFGFQTTCATTVASTNINKWGTLPVGTQNIKKKQRNYVEHSVPQATNIFSIPWKAPSAGTGSVTFYTAANVVNGNNKNTKDDPTDPATLVVAEATAKAPVAFNNVKGEIKNNLAVISWSTAAENNIKNFAVEKSIDAVNYKSIALIAPKGNTDYSFTDNSFSSKAYYRIKVTQNDGAIAYYNSLTIAAPSKNNYNLSLTSHAGIGSLSFYNGSKQQKVQVTYSDIQGRPLHTINTIANEGANIWPVKWDKVNGITIVNVTTEDGIKTSIKLGSR